MKDRGREVLRRGRSGPKGPIIENFRARAGLVIDKFGNGCREILRRGRSAPKGRLIEKLQGSAFEFAFNSSAGQQAERRQGSRVVRARVLA